MIALNVLFFTVFISALCASTFVAAFYVNSYKIQTVCREKSVAILSRTRSGIEGLIALNALVKSLKLQYLQANAQLALAVATYNAPLAAATKVRMLQIRLAQAALVAKQNFLIRTGEILNTADLLKLRFLLENTSTSIRGRMQIGKMETRFNVPTSLSWSVRPTADTYPEYHLQPLIHEMQKLQINWREDLQPIGEKTKWKENHLQQTFYCGATLIARGKKLSVRLVEGK